LQEPSHPSHHPGDSVTFAVFPGVDLLLADVTSTEDPNDVQITGPEKTLADLSKLLGTSEAPYLEVSPRAAVTVPMEYREDAGIPLNAHAFAFIYPSENVRILEKVQAVKNKARQSWAFVLLIGGYAYYDEKGALISINAIAFAETEQSLLLVGPYRCSQAGTNALDGQGRLRPVTVSEVAEAGFSTQAWAHPSERFGGELLSATVDYHHGGFVFARKRSNWVEVGGEELQQWVWEPVLYQLMTKAEYAALGYPGVIEGPLLSDAVEKLLAQSATAVAIKDACTTDLFADAPRVEDEKKLVEELSEAELFRLHAAQAAGVCAYLFAGSLFYHLNETSPRSCEPGTDDSVACPWTWTDSIYFLSVTVSTVGYGDFAPTTTGSRFMTLFFVISGVSVIFTLFGHAMKAALGKLEVLAAAFVRFPDATARTPAAQYYASKLGFTFTFGSLAFFFFSAAVFTWLQPSLSFGDALWHCIITATTVGYGDVGLINEEARGFATVHVLLSASWLAALIQQAQQTVAKRGFELDRLALVQSQLDPTLIDRLERTKGAGVDKVEYVVGMLVALGAELCGEKLNFAADIQPLISRFDALDADGSGRLETDDLLFMLEEGKKAQAKKEGALAAAAAAAAAAPKLGNKGAPSFMAKPSFVSKPSGVSLGPPPGGGNQKEGGQRSARFSDDWAA